MEELKIRTERRSELKDITGEIQRIVEKSGVKDGICVVYCPHTTAGLIVNENYDPSVKMDILETLERLVPYGANYHHTEGNADSHIKASICGSSLNLLIEGGKIVLGTWQGIFFCEFDGPRTRRVLVKVMGRGDPSP